jgi:hypothetical protein
MHRSILVTVASAAVALSMTACDAPADQATSRDYVVHNVVDARSIVSEVLRGDELVAEAVLAEGRHSITILADDWTMVSAPLDFDARAEIDDYTAYLAGAVGVLEQAQAQALPRADCGFRDYYDLPADTYCIESWCSDGCRCVDCVPIDHPVPEYHYCNEQCFPVLD